MWYHLAVYHLSSFGWIQQVTSKVLDSIWNGRKSLEQGTKPPMNKAIKKMYLIFFVKKSLACFVTFVCISLTLYNFFVKKFHFYDFLNLTFETAWSKITRNTSLFSWTVLELFSELFLNSCFLIRNGLTSIVLMFI